MAIFESAFPSLLQGVTQQVARARLPGQISLQENMLSDPVTGIRRRPGIEFGYSKEKPGATSDSIVAWYTDIAGFQVHVVLDTVSGILYIQDDNYNTLATLPASTYLQAGSAAMMRAASVGDSLFIANTDIIPGKSTAGQPTTPKRTGFFFIKASAFSKTYTITVRNGYGTWTYSYTTPNGTNAGDPALATTDYIAAQLQNAVQANTGTNHIGTDRVGSYVILQMTGENGQLSVTSGSGSAYLMPSGASYVRQESDLPAVLPAAGGGYIVGTGPEKAMVYYKYSYATQQWLESGEWGSPVGLVDMPVELKYNADTSAWVLDETAYEGRFSGNEITNEAPQFLDWGITGLSSFQGRLVILAGSWVSLSASGKPRRFYRSTVTDILDADPIHIGSSSTSSAAYQYALPFSKDLLLFSAKYQALIPASNTAITPRTAQVVVTSTYASDMSSGPVALGRTVMYPAPRSADFFGVLEMLPSPYADSQYVSTDSTEHLPKYLAGRCRFSVSSSVANMVIFGPSGDKRSLIVHEYSWSGEEKILRAWHRWTFQFDVAYAYFSGEIINIMFVRNGILINCKVDPRIGILTEGAGRRPYLDFYVPATAVDRDIAVPAHLVAFAGDALNLIKVGIATGDLAGQEIGVQLVGTNLHTVPSFPSGDVYIGYEYYSAFSPTAPEVRDQNGLLIGTNKLTTLRYHVITKDTAEFDVQIRDYRNTGDPVEYPVTPLYWTSPELQLGKAPVSGESSVTLPIRSAADTTTVILSTSGLGELNVLGIEFVCKYHQKLSRR